MALASVSLTSGYPNGDASGWSARPNRSGSRPVRQNDEISIPAPASPLANGMKDKGDQNEKKTRIRSGVAAFSSKMDELRKCGWYWGPISWQEAEDLLCDQANGAFLVRDSTDDRHIFSLSFKTERGVQHARINQHGGEFFFGSPNTLLSSKTIVGLIESAMRCSSDGTLRFLAHPTMGAFPVDTILLMHPFSRFTVVPSLKHVARFEILKHLATRDKIDQLPIPGALKIYLKDPKYISDL